MDRRQALGLAITSHRTARAMARKELAAEAGISYPYLSEIESGTKVPTIETLWQIAEALGRVPSQLLTTAELLEADEDILR
jgi:transcriptional regulator with XRE-family HTH domain